MIRFHAFLAALLCLACFSAQAQWQWVDKDGRKVFSDRAPPADIPAKSILKQPGGSARAAAAPASPVTGSPNAALAAAEAASTAAASGQAGSAQPAPDAPKVSGVDKELAEKKKQAEAAAAAKVKAEDDRVAKAKVENCERARAGKAMMDSGVRVSVTNAKGEREVLEDAGRAAQVRRLQQQMDANCS